MILTPMVRYDLYSDFPGSLTYKLAAVFTLSDSVSLKASGGKSYRAPTLNDLYWPNDGFSEGNPNLKPETGYSGDLGLSAATERLEVNAFAFVRYVQDGIQWTETSPSFYQPTNVGEALFPGAEADVDFQPIKGLHLSGSYTFQYSFVLKGASASYTFADDKRAVYTPVHSASGANRAKGTEQPVEAGGPVAHRHDHGDVGRRVRPRTGLGDRVGGPRRGEAVEQPLLGGGRGHGARAAGAGQLGHQRLTPGAEAEQAQGRAPQPHPGRHPSQRPVGPVAPPVSGGAAHTADMPPSTASTVPVTPDAPGEHSQAMASATSAGCNRRPRVWCPANSSGEARPYTAAEAARMSVSTEPGDTALAVTPESARSAAIDRTNPTTACLAAA